MNRWLLIGAALVGGYLLLTDSGRRMIGMSPPAALPPANPVAQYTPPTGAPIGGCPPQLSGAQCLDYLNNQENTKREQGWQGLAGNLGGSLLKGLGVG